MRIPSRYRLGQKRIAGAVVHQNLPRNNLAALPSARHREMGPPALLLVFCSLGAGRVVRHEDEQHAPLFEVWEHHDS